MKIEFKDYPKIQENYFVLSKEIFKKRLQAHLYYIDPSLGVDFIGFGGLVRNLTMDFSKKIYDYFVKAVWLSRKYMITDCMFGGAGKIECHTTDPIKRSFNAVLRKYAKTDPYYYFIKPNFSPLITYIDDLCPDLESKNPFVDKIEFPYKHINIYYLLVVTKICYRMELLKIAEERNMGYDQFLDFVWNWTVAFNDEAEKDVFTFVGNDRMGERVFVKDKEYEYK